jgi:glycosyltransferase involved in cell wall biosynthesis
MISIIIPAYNAGKTIEKCLDSIAKQTDAELEIIAVNDGSTDNTLELINQEVEKFRNRGIRFEIISQENSGANVARNRGSFEAKGEYLLFLDADIEMEASMLEEMKGALDKNPEASYAYSSHYFGFKLFRLFPFSADRLREMPYIHTSSLILLEHFPGFDDALTRKRLQDWDLWLTMLEAGHTGIWIDKPLFRIETGGTMSSWLPGFAHKLFPFLPKVKSYNNAVEFIKHKHNLK